MNRRNALGALAILACCISTRVSAAVDGMGAFTNHVPIDVPAFRGIAPTVSLDYSSNSGSGMVGVGWHLTAGSSITRMSANRGVPHYDATDIFLLDGQELVPCAPSSTSPSCSTAVTAFGTSAGFYWTRIESFVRIRYNASIDRWTVYERNGTVRSYAPVLHSRSYELVSVSDTHANTVNYSQFCDGVDACYPQSITYASGPGAAGVVIRFYVEARPDNMQVAVGGALATMRYRVRAISVAMDNQLVRAYALTYAPSAATGASILRTIQEFGRDASVDPSGRVLAGATPPLPAMRLDTPSTVAGATPGSWAGRWVTTTAGLPTVPAQSPAPGPRTLYTTTTVPQPAPFRTDLNGNDVFAPYGEVWGDWNGDGREDWGLWWTDGTDGGFTFESMLSGPAGHGAVVASGFYSTKALAKTCPTWGGCAPVMFVGDFNGDGREELLAIQNGTMWVSYAIDTGQIGPVTPPSPLQRTSIAIKTDRCSVADVDGDGRSDLVCIDSGSSQISTFLSNGNGTFTTVSYPHAIATTDRLALGDINGDGLADVVLATQSASQWQLVTGRSNGDGSYTWDFPGTATGWTAPPSTDAVRLLGGDFDGDGHFDVIIDHHGRTIADDLSVALSRKGSGGRWRIIPTIAPSWAYSPLSIGDRDGDGRDDIMIGENVTFARSDGNGGFFAPTTTPAPGTCGNAARADLDGDSLADFLCMYDDSYGSGNLLISDSLAPPSTADLHRWMTADVNGDGIDDEVYVRYRNPGYDIYTVFANTNQRVVWTYPTNLGPAPLEPDAGRWMPMDVGGPTGAADGKSDLVLVQKSGSTLGVFTLISNGDGTWAPHYQAPWPAGYGAVDLQHWRPAKLNNDGRMDLVHLYALGNGVRVEMLISNGNGTWQATGHDHWTGGNWPLRSIDVQNMVALDLNGDGMTDFVHIESGPPRSVPDPSNPAVMKTVSTVVRVLLSNGSSDWTEPLPTVSTSAVPPGFRWTAADYNGDGTSDLIQISHGSLASAASSLAIIALVADGAGGFALVAPPTNWPSLSGGDLGERVDDTNLAYAIDVNGDGITDVVHVTEYYDASGTRQTAFSKLLHLATGGWSLDTTTFTLAYDDHEPWSWHPWRAPYSGNAGVSYTNAQYVVAMEWVSAPDRISLVDNGRGATTAPSYAPLVGPNSRTYLPVGMAPMIVYSVATSDNAYSPPVVETTTYGYGQALWSDAQRTILGFGATTAADANHFVSTTFTLDDKCHSRPASIVQSSPSGTVYRYRTISPVVPTQFFPDPPTRCLPQTVRDYSCELSSTCRLDRQVDTTWDFYGNPTQEQTTVTGGETKIVTAPVYGNALGYIVDHVAYRDVSGVKNGVSSTLAYTAYLYDGSTSSVVPPPGAGELRTVQRATRPNGPMESSTFQYDSAGMLIRETDPAGVWHAITYDAAHDLFPVHSCVPALCTDETWDPVLGVRTALVDANARTTTFSYDAFGRPTKTVDPSLGSVATFYLATGTITGPASGRQRVRTEVSDGSAVDGVLWSETFVDGLGRPYRTTKEGGATQDTTYGDASRRPAKVSLMYASGGAPTAWTSFQYDGLARPTLVTLPDGHTRGTAYAIGQVTATDENGHTKTALTDGNGDTFDVGEHNGAATIHTTYHHDALGRLDTITDAGGNISTITYDYQGRQIATTDPDRGARSYTYAPGGQVASNTDALGQTTTFGFDPTGRLTSRSEADATGAVVRTVSWTWDAIPGVGKLGDSTGRIVEIDDSQPTATASEQRTYNPSGRVTQSQQCIDGHCMTFQMAYDPAGRLSTLTYPDANGNPGGEYVDTTYDDAGHTVRLTGIVGGATYTIDDELASLSLANGVTESYAYDPARRWLTTLDVSHGTPLYHEDLTRDAVGRIQHERSTGASPTDEAFAFDDLGRLTSVASTDTAHVESFTYDTIGRMAYSSTAGDYHYADPLHVHAVTHGDLGYDRTYDANGQVTSIVDPTRSLTIAWSTAGRPAAISGTSGALAYAYDVDGARIKKQSTAGNTYYFGRYVELAPGGALIKYYYAGGRMIARRDATGLAFYHGDHLHSTRLETDALGGPANHYDYRAFGAPIRTFAPLTNDFTFTGARADSETGLVQMGARYYDPTLARFVSADSMIPGVYDPQALDRYSFVENDPIDFVDPTGHMKMQVEWKKYQDWLATAHYPDRAQPFCMSASWACESRAYQYSWHEEGGQIAWVTTPDMTQEEAAWEIEQSKPKDTEIELDPVTVGGKGGDVAIGQAQAGNGTNPYTAGAQGTGIDAKAIGGGYNVENLQPGTTATINVTIIEGPFAGTQLTITVTKDSEGNVTWSTPKTPTGVDIKAEMVVTPAGADLVLTQVGATTTKTDAKSVSGTGTLKASVQATAGEKADATIPVASAGEHSEVNAQAGGEGTVNAATKSEVSRQYQSTFAQQINFQWLNPEFGPPPKPNFIVERVQ